jgi:alpha-beta hydrolase superfamily lysophospholipase
MEHKAKRRYLLITVALVLVLVLILLLLFTGIAGWMASGRLLQVTETWYTVTLRVSGATEETVTLPRRRETAYAGIYGITWEKNYAVLGEMVESSEQTVTRRIIKSTQPLAVGLLVTWNIFVYVGDPQSALGQAYDDVRIPSELGPLPAWFVPGQRATWVLLVHGFHASREEALRVLPKLSQMGFPALVMTYRNDVGAPKSPDGFYHLGDTEWQDIEAGVRYALGHGAQDVVLYGWSMGGCIVETLLHRSSEAAHVRAVVLDAPILDWHGALDAQLHSLHFPHWFTHVMKWFVARRAGIDFNALNFVHLAGETATPTLLFHGAADIMVPIAESDTFAQASHERVTYQQVNSADHTQAWNVDPQAYEDALTSFLTRVSEPESHAIDI